MRNRQRYPKARRRSHSLVAARTRRECQNDRSSGDRTDKLSDAIQYKPHRTDDSCKEQGQADIRVEQSASNAIKQPRGNQETEPEVDRSDKDIERIRGGLAYASGGRCGLYSSIGESEEEEGADELKEGAT